MSWRHTEARKVFACFRELCDAVTSVEAFHHSAAIVKIDDPVPDRAGFPCGSKLLPQRGLDGPQPNSSSGTCTSVSPLVPSAA